MTTAIGTKQRRPRAIARRVRRASGSGGGKGKPYALALEDDLLAIGMRVPPEERAKLPRDFNENLDHYLYGAPRKAPRRT
jgi:hypothetical protein